MELFGHTLRGLQDQVRLLLDGNKAIVLRKIFSQVASVRRIVARSDADPVNTREVQHNPNLNPLLSGYVPFDSQDSVNTFMESVDRVVALQRYVRSQVPWEEASFVRNMVRLVCTREYRYNHDYIGLKTRKVSPC